MLKTFYMRKEDAFSRNLSECKSAVFGLRYSDITAMCGIPQSTMATYEGNRAPYISPFLSAAKKLADM
ncbi:MAG: hypothetical protein LUD72_04725, partial [Bacteroidales bacterium]|nr:hypothetical protein [Bacteroidales bacterium]